jgi:hypothetical protein
VIWCKSSRSESVNCVEVRNTLSELRDSKNSPAILRGDVPRLVRAIKDGRL